MIKKSICLLILTSFLFSMASCSFSSHQPADTIEETGSEDTKIDWRSAYVDFLRNDFEPEYNDPRFAFIYVDDNDIPELVIGEGFFHAAGALLYTYSNGEVVPVNINDLSENRFGDYGSISYKEREGLILHQGMSMGYAGTVIFKIINNEAEYVIRMNDDEGAVMPGHSPTYTIDDINVSESEYKKRLAELDTSGYTSINYDAMNELTEDRLNSLMQYN
ncbi:MAG: hypothetical protein IKW02_02620 [Clostridia bacterium]|nr:hypothetical protein [Clostridia bacterium]